MSSEKIKKFDLDKDGNISEEELKKLKTMYDINNDDAKEKAQRKMAWFGLIGMLLYPFAVVIVSLFEMKDAADTLGDMAPTYFVAIAGLVAAFFGAQAYTKGK